MPLLSHTGLIVIQPGFQLLDQSVFLLKPQLNYLLCFFDICRELLLSQLIISLEPL